MRRTGIAKYDETRVAIVPLNGLTEVEAKSFQAMARKYDWKDLKIVATKDVHKTLAVVCKPKTWENIMTIWRLKGMDIPLGYMDKFRKEAHELLKHDKDPEIHKEQLTHEEKELKKKVVETIYEKEERGDYALQDMLEEEADKTWEQEEE